MPTSRLRGRKELQELPLAIGVETTPCKQCLGTCRLRKIAEQNSSQVNCTGDKERTNNN